MDICNSSSFIFYRLSYEIYEGSLGACGPLPLLSWTVHINGLRSRHRAGMQKFHPELKEGVGNSLSYSQGVGGNLPETMAVLTRYLNWLDGEGFKVMGNSMDSSIYHGGVTKTQIYTLQMPETSPVP